MNRRFVVVALVCTFGVLSARAAGAATVPFTEDFTTSVSGWGNPAGTGLLTHVATGGPDGGDYATTTFATNGLALNSTPPVFRGQDEFNSSNHAFEGNWLNQGIAKWSAYVRHNAPHPVTFVTRFADPGNTPGASALFPTPVQPNTWTQISFDIYPTNPAFITFGGQTYEAVFDNIGHIQISPRISTELAAATGPYTFDVDKVSISAVPEPTSILMVTIVGLAAFLRRRGRS